MSEDAETSPPGETETLSADEIDRMLAQYMGLELADVQNAADIPARVGALSKNDIERIIDKALAPNAGSVDAGGGLSQEATDRIIGGVDESAAISALADPKIPRSP